MTKSNEHRKAKQAAIYSDSGIRKTDDRQTDRQENVERSHGLAHCPGPWDYGTLAASPTHCAAEENLQCYISLLAQLKAMCHESRHILAGATISVQC